jgi:hypothetical protein
MQFAATSPGKVEGNLLVERGPLAGHRYRVEFRVCQNPVCRCERIGFNCFRDANDSLQRESFAPSYLEMDLEQRVVANLEKLKADPAAFDLAEAVAAEITPEAWSEIRRLYIAVKMLQTERADLNQLEAEFPTEILAGGATMIGYYEVLPYARPVDFSLNGDTWRVDDQYCVQPRCSCRDCALSFIQLPSFLDPKSPLINSSLSLRYHYDSGRSETLPLLPDEKACLIPGQEFLDALKTARPDFNSLLIERHALLRRLFRRALSRQKVHVSTQKPRRNDSCPCGSGKKYKHCCGAAL